MRHYIAYFLLLIAQRLSPKVWSSTVTSTTNNIAVTVSMAYLDRIGIRHCDLCAQINDLMCIDNKLFCHQHTTGSTSNYESWLLK